MHDANCLPPFRWRKKKGNLIPTSFFLQQQTNNSDLPVTPKTTQVEETEKPYETPSTQIEKKIESIPDAKNEPSPPAPNLPEINISSENKKEISSFSLASIQKKKEWEQKHKKEIVEEENLPNDAFTQVQLNQHWKAYQSEKSQKGEQNIASLFQLNQPALLDNNRIEYTVPSSLNKVELEREFVHFLPYLRKALNNFSVQIEVLVKASEEKNYIYTPEEKYNRLREINPQIDDLRKELDLDL